MCILNGRAPGENDFTCIRPQGRSVVDYFFTSLENIQCVKRFYVKRVKELLIDMNNVPVCSLPDHSILIII